MIFFACEILVGYDSGMLVAYEVVTVLMVCFFFAYWRSVCLKIFWMKFLFWNRGHGLFVVEN